MERGVTEGGGSGGGGGCSGKDDRRETQCDTLNQLCKRSFVSNSIDHYVPLDGGGKIGAGHSCGG